MVQKNPGLHLGSTVFLELADSDLQGRNFHIRDEDHPIGSWQHILTQPVEDVLIKADKRITRETTLEIIYVPAGR